MANPNVLKSVVYSLVQSFASRNNDVNGYWALGKLYELALKKNSKRIEIDFLHGTMTCPDPQFKAMIDHYRLFIQKQARDLGLRFDLMSSATVEIVFEDNPPKMPANLLTLRGEPFSCTGTLIYEGKKTFKGTVNGFCAPHDPGLENRSGRSHGE